jgi:hypothetical protein
VKSTDVSSLAGIVIAIILIVSIWPYAFPVSGAVVSTTTVSTTKSDNLVPSPNPQNSTFDPSTIPGYFGSDIGTFSTSTAPNGFTFSTAKSDSMTMGLPTVGGSPVTNSLVYSNSSHTAYKLSGSYGTLNVFFKHSPYSTKISIKANLLSAQVVCLPFTSANPIVQSNQTVRAGNEVFDWRDISAIYLPAWNTHSLCLSLPSGITNIDPIALDGSGSAGCSSPCALLAVTLTTSSTNDILIVYFGGNCGGTSPTTNTVTDLSALTWTKRTHLFQSGFAGWVDEFYSTDTNALSSDVVTAHLGGCASANMAVIAFGVSGGNVGNCGSGGTTCFDSNGALPATGKCSGGGCGVVVDTVTGVSTSNANDMLISGDFNANGGGAFTAAGGFTLVTSQTTGGGGETSSEYKVVSSTQSSITVTYGGGDSDGFSYVMIVDALKANAATVTQPIKITTANGAPSATITISGCAASNGTFTANGNVKHYSSITASCSITLTKPSDPNAYSGYRFNISPHPTVSNSISFSSCAGPGTCAEYDNTTWLIQEQVYNATAQTPNKWDGTYTGLTAKGEFLGVANSVARSCNPGSVTQGDTTDTVCGLAVQFTNGPTFDYNTPVTLQNPIGGSWFSTDNVFTDTTAGNTDNAHYTQVSGGEPPNYLWLLAIPILILVFMIIARKR